MNRLSSFALCSALAISATGTGVASAAGAHHKPCSRKGSKTIASNSHTRVYSVPTADGSKLYGCLRSADKPRRLFVASDDGYVTSQLYDRVTLTGRFVAWQVTDTDDSCKADCPPGYNPTTKHLDLRDLRKSKTRNVVGEVDPKGKLVVTTGGALAWVEPGYAIKAFDRAGARTLDTAPTIEPGSLRRHNNDVSWANAGVSRSATLTPPR